jgi:hypothetical protein
LPEKVNLISFRAMIRRSVLFEIMSALATSPSVNTVGNNFSSLPTDMFITPAPMTQLQGGGRSAAISLQTRHPPHCGSGELGDQIIRQKSANQILQGGLASKSGP